jgi:hypothetical protein
VLGDTPEHALAGMVKALRSSGVPTRPCDQWSLQELNNVALQLLRERDPAFDDLYKKKNDRRSLHFDPKSAHKELLWEAERLIEVGSRAFNLTRDGKCAELSMWWVHHLPHHARTKLSSGKGFSLPEPPTQVEDTAVAKAHGAGEYVYQVTCSSCHVTIKPGGGGFVPAPPPTPPSGPKWDVCDDYPDFPGGVWYEGEKAPVGTRKKRCDWDYDPKPVMCEAIGGIIWGEGKDEINITECEPYMNASDIPKDNLTSPGYPSVGFTVKEYAVGVNQCDKVGDPFGCQFPGAKPCAPHKFLNETYHAEYYDGSAGTGPRVTVMRADGNIFQGTDGNMYIQTLPNHPRFDFCICVNTAQDSSPTAPVSGALRHDFAKDAILIGRERIKVEYLNRWVIADHWMKGPHNFWVEVSTNLMVRGWQPYNGLQIWYDWNTTMPDEDKFTVPKGCYTGFLHRNISCRAPPPSEPLVV